MTNHPTGADVPSPATTVAAETPLVADLELLELARQARQQAYVPYSRYAVGAALLDDQGRVFLGCNVENASYPLTCCAERTAVFKAVSEGSRSFRAIAVVSDNDEPAAPCGACRQVLFEFAPSLRVVLGNLKGDRRVTTAAELLPYGFGPHYLR